MSESNTVAFEAILASIKTLQSGEGEVSLLLKVPHMYLANVKDLLDHVGAVFTVAMADPRGQQ